MAVQVRQQGGGGFHAALRNHFEGPRRELSSDELDHAVSLPACRPPA